jgi:hypothetical protein
MLRDTEMKQLSDLARSRKVPLSTAAYDLISAGLMK